MYVVVGATGNTGKAIAEKLLASGAKVRVIGRSQERLRDLVEAGAEASVGSVEDEATMVQAFRGARAAYTMIPPNMAAEDFRRYQDRVGVALATAIEKAGLTHVVNLSSLGAYLPAKAGPVSGLHAFEERLNGINVLSVLHLRAGLFMENIFYTMDMIKTMGFMGGALRGDLPLPMIATRDIAAVAAAALLQRNFAGIITRELLGQRDLTWAAVATIVGKALGKRNLGYLQFPYGDAEQAMIRMGISPSAARALTEMYSAINEGTLRPLEIRSLQNTTPTSIETFVAQEFVPRFQGRAAAAGAGSA